MAPVGRNARTRFGLCAKREHYAYVASPGQIAHDGHSGNGVYTGALLQHIDTADCPIETLFKRVRNTVAASTAGKQITWEHTSLAGGGSDNRGDSLKTAGTNCLERG